MYQYELAVHYRTFIYNFILWLDIVCWSIQIYSYKKNKKSISGGVVMLKYI